MDINNYMDETNFMRLTERRSSISSIATEDSGYSSIFRTVNNVQVYSSKHEYLIAMMEDLSLWLKQNHSGLNIGVDTFCEVLESGVILCEQAVQVQKAGEEYFDKESDENIRKTKILPVKFSNCTLRLPTTQPTFQSIGSKLKLSPFVCRDNVASFIAWLRQLGFSDSVMFETEDLISRKNIRNVVLALLELSRVGGLFGLSVPTLVTFEREIDAEIAAEQEAMKSYDESTLEGMKKSSVSNDEIDYQSNHDDITKDEDISENNNCETRSTLDPIQKKFTNKIVSKNQIKENIHVEKEDEKVEEVEVEEEEEEVVDKPKHVIKSKPYAAPCNIQSLDELVREILLQCRCESTFPMTRLAEGKYLFGDKNTLIYVRVLNSHVMVRVGGGWNTLHHMLNKSDPCRKNNPTRNIPQTAATTVADTAPIYNKRKMSLDVSGTATLPRTPRKSTRRLSVQVDPPKIVPSSKYSSAPLESVDKTKLLNGYLATISGHQNRCLITTTTIPDQNESLTTSIIAATPTQSNPPIIINQNDSSISIGCSITTPTGNNNNNQLETETKKNNSCSPVTDFSIVTTCCSLNNAQKSTKKRPTTLLKLTKIPTSFQKNSPSFNNSNIIRKPSINIINNHNNNHNNIHIYSNRYNKIKINGSKIPILQMSKLNLTQLPRRNSK